MKKALIAVFFLCFALKLFGADTGKAIIATTEDGRKVVLLANGTWQWLDSAPSAPQSSDQNWQKIISYLADQGYTIKNNDGVSKTLSTDWQNRVHSKLNSKCNSEPNKVCDLANGYEMMMTIILSENTPKLIFKYRTILDPSKGYFDLTLEKICKNPMMKNGCKYFTGNEKMLNEEISALVKPADSKETTK